MTDSVSIAQNHNAEQDELSLFDILAVLFKHKKVVIGLPVACAVVAAGISLALPNQYQSSILIVPQAQGVNMAPALLSLAGSDQVRGSILDQFKLQQHYQSSDRRDALLALDSSVKSSLTKDQLLEIQVLDRDPQTAAALADGYASAIIQAAHDNRLSPSAAFQANLQARMTITEQQRKEAESKLEAISPAWPSRLSDQDRAIASALGQMQAELAAKDFFNSNDAKLTDQSSPIVKLQEQINLLRQDMAVKSRAGTTPELLTAYSDMVFYASLKQRLQQSLALSKAQQANEIRIVAKADVPLRKEKPKRALIAALAFLAGGMLAALYAFAREGLDKAGGWRHLMRGANGQE
ncbi:GNVR domain-containing protein [Crenobacter sp. SG2305]|uniref:GNVR domain-containing protein n=1 Tax=Crenobacter oryzisoli TaxID=3056844 RepID=UPI0025AB036E|nr:GNVR domain-containing protein [Crenobacter sp. SG2305]MDN0083430.1 GNVR domain-containing protein [Crenobacter sp. SG2305]